jgi:hypothetical protein
MDITKLSSIISLLIALSMASERLVEIVKTSVTSILTSSLIDIKEDNIYILGSKQTEPRKERKRLLTLYFVSLISGCVTVWLAKDIIPKEVLSIEYNTLNILGMGLLVSGGSSFWNSALGYANQVKEVTKLEAEKKAKEK